jgi:DNA-binding HxlR family transcriptional regulator
MRFDPESGECNEIGPIVRPPRLKPLGVIKRLMDEIPNVLVKYPEGIMDVTLFIEMRNRGFLITPAVCTRAVNRLVELDLIVKKEWNKDPDKERYQLFPKK